jgi:PGAP1-like protein
MSSISPPYYPIVYVRGYAMTQREIDATVATPYMGFNLGATKARQDWRGQVRRHIFESCLVRLMKDYGYRDTFADGTERDTNLPAKSIVIYRYYEMADSDLGTGHAPSVESAAEGLGELILKLREQVCGGDAAERARFKVCLVAHSMGGLVCRSFLQNSAIASAEAKSLVDKVFTYATPHNGIEMAGINVPGFIGLFDIDNFNRKRMREYLELPGVPERVDSLNGRFDPNRFFCLVGTNHRDYAAAAGMSRRLAGEMSDGLVQIENATVRGAPRAFAFRSHSGDYGIVNSEEGYQNLTRFLFGDLRVDAVLEVEELPLPPSVRKAHEAGKRIRASYYFESVVTPRGAVGYTLSERRKETYSAILRSFDELLRIENVAGLDGPRSPFLFSLYLDSARVTSGRSIVFGAEIVVSSTDYEIDGFLVFDHHVEGEALYRNHLTIRATPAGDGWNLRYNLSDERWSEGRGSDVESDAGGPFVPLTSPKGFRGKLRLRYRAWQ